MQEPFRDRARRRDLHPPENKKQPKTQRREANSLPYEDLDATSRRRLFAPYPKIFFLSFSGVTSLILIFFYDYDCDYDYEYDYDYNALQIDAVHCKLMRRIAN